MRSAACTAPRSIPRDRMGGAVAPSPDRAAETHVATNNPAIRTVLSAFGPQPLYRRFSVAHSTGAHFGPRFPPWIALGPPPHEQIASLLWSIWPTARRGPRPRWPIWRQSGDHRSFHHANHTIRRPHIQPRGCLSLRPVHSTFTSSASARRNRRVPPVIQFCAHSLGLRPQ
jgi:hypothetical protein